MTRTPRPDLGRVRHSKVAMAVEFDPPLGCATAVAESWPRARSGDLEITETRFTRHWRRDAFEGYPGYDALWPAFAADFSALSGRAEAAGEVGLTVSACELTYMNPISADEDWHRSGQIERLLLTWLGRELAGPYLPRPDDVVTEATFHFPEHGPRTGGTLTVSLEAIAHEGPEPLMGMTLTARGAVDGAADGLGAAKAFFDTAFEWVVRGYASVAPLEADEPRPRLRMPRRRSARS